MNRVGIINFIAEKIGAKDYLEIGTRRGQCLQEVVCENKVGVDPDPKATASHRMTSDEFFAANNRSFDIVFIDGLHEHQQVLRDIDNSLKCLNEGGYIVVHDCSPQKEIEQVVPRQTARWNGDVWKAIVVLRATRPHLDICVVDTDEGCGVIREGTQELIEPAELTYDNLVRDRSEWLNLISIEDFKNKIE